MFHYILWNTLKHPRDLLSVGCCCYFVVAWGEEREYDCSVIQYSENKKIMNYKIELHDYWSRVDLNGKGFLPVGGGAIAVNNNDNRAYIYGGSDFKSGNNKLYSFDFSDNSFNIIDELNINNRINHRMFYTKNNQLCIAGGAVIDSTHKNIKYCDEIIVYDIAERKTEKLEIPPNKMERGQFTASINYEENVIYVFGGFAKKDFFKIDLNTMNIEDIEPEGDCPGERAGMIAEILPNGNLFIFSGFNIIDNASVCFNDYFLYNPKTNIIKKTVLTDKFGRTFSKSIVVESLNKVIIFGGTVNGMESSGSLYFYDYKEDIFNHAGIQPLPVERVEPMAAYSKKNNKMYIISGLEPMGREGYKAIDEIMILDFNILKNDVWLGHP